MVRFLGYWKKKLIEKILNWYETNQSWRTYDKLVKIPFQPDIRQIRHHMGDHLEAGVFGHFLEGFRDGLDGMAAVRVPRNVLVDALHANL